MEQLDELEKRRRGRPRKGDPKTSHQRLVSTARQVFARRGYGGTSLQEVAERAGVSRPAVSYYFPEGKLQLYWAVTEAIYCDVLKPAIDRAGEKSTLMDQISVFLNVAGHAVVDDMPAVAFLCTSATQCQSHPELRHPHHDPVTATRRFLTLAVNEAVGRGELSADTEQPPLVATLLAMLGGIGFYAAFVGEPKQVNAIAAQIHQQLTGGLPAGSL